MHHRAKPLWPKVSQATMGNINTGSVSIDRQRDHWSSHPNKIPFYNHFGFQ